HTAERPEGLSDKYLMSDEGWQSLMQDIRGESHERAITETPEAEARAGEPRTSRAGAGGSDSAEVARGKEEAAGGAIGAREPVQGTLFAKTITPEFRKKGDISPQEIHDGTWFLLRNGRWAGVAGAAETVEHADLSLKIIKEINPIRMAGSNAYELVGPPTESQRTELARIANEGGHSEINWDF